MNRTCELMKKHLPTSIKFTNPERGFFLWLVLPEEIDTEKLLQHCIEKYKVNFIIGASTSPTRSNKNCVRLSISFCTIDKIEIAILKLSQALRELQKM